MCGLMGLIESADNGFTHANMSAFKLNLFVNALRGSDSTGVVGVNKKGSSGIIKELGSSSSLMSSNPKWDKFQDGLFQEGKIAFGHGRAATRGDVTLDNAHPFVIDNGKKGKDRHYIILAHNGTLHGTQTLKNFHEFDVDSAWMAQQIFDLGPEEALSKINGAIATMWWDSKEKAFFVFRNHERPLHFIQHNGTTHINSEGGVLMFLKYKLGLQYEWKDLAQFTTDTLYRFDIKDPSKFTAKPIKKWYEPIQSRWAGHGRKDVEDYSGNYERSRAVIPLFGPPKDDYEKEVGQVWNDTIKQIVFLGGRKVITYEGKSISEEICDPWEEHLTKISKIQDTDKSFKLRFDYYHENQATFILLDRINWHQRVAVFNRRRARSKKNELSIDCELKAGKRVHFHTKVDSVTIRHQALCENRLRPAFGVYTNSVDGTFVLGQQVPIEVFGAIPQNDTVGSAMKYEALFHVPKEEGGISPELEFFFFDHLRTKAEIFDIAKFVGTVIHMSPQTNEEAEANKTHIKLFLANVKPASAFTEPELKDMRDLIRTRSFEDGITKYKDSNRIITGPANEDE